MLKGLNWRKIMFAAIVTVVSGAAVMLFGKSTKMPTKKVVPKNSFYKINVRDINGDIFNLKKYAGKKILIVNVASKCGYTSQYSDLQKLYRQYNDKLEVIAVPCNDFGRQEPGAPSEISDFCEVNYGVTFPILEKSNIKSDPKSELYDWLTDDEKNGWNNSAPSWNFCKYLIDEHGNLIRFFRSGVGPMSKDILSLL